MWITLLEVILVIPLTVWRISNLLADTDQSGPFNVLDWLRMKAGVKYDEHSLPYAKRGGLGDMLICVYCNSLWLGILFTIGLLLNTQVTIIVSLPLALSGVAILIQNRLK